jgi:phospholipid/cholesterol/gamma-HCH transport system substrate-binding protein
MEGVLGVTVDHGPSVVESLSGRPGPCRFAGLLAGVLAVPLAGLLGGCTYSLQSLPQPGAPSGPTYRVTAIFRDALNLPRGAQVKLNGIVVGQVTKISAEDFKARVTMLLKKSAQLREGSTAQVRFDTPLGNEFVALTSPAGSAPLLPDHAVLGVQDTSKAPTVEDAFSAISVLLNGGGLDQLHTIVTELNAAFNGNEGPARGVLEHLDRLAETLSAQLPNFDRALDAVNQLSGQLANDSGTITAGLTKIAPALQVLSSQSGDVARLLASVNNLSDVTTNVVHQDTRAIVADVNELVPVVKQLVDVQGKLGPALADVQRFETLTQRAVPGDYINIYVSVLGLLGNGTNPETGTASSRAAVSGAAASSDVSRLLSQGLS